MGPSATSLPTVLRAWIDFRSRSWTSPRTATNRKIMVRGWITVLGEDFDVRTISPLDVQRLFLARDNGQRSGATLNGERESLSGFLGWLRDMGIIEANPLSRAAWTVFDPDRKRSPRSRVHVKVTSSIVEQVLDLSLLKYHRILLFIFLTGVRLGEAFTALWRWVETDPRDPASRILRIPGPKRKPRQECIVILSDAAVRILGRPGLPDERIFPEIKTKISVQKTLERIGRKLGIAHLGAHQFRRSLATHLLNSGIPLPAVSHQLGWRSPPREVLELLRESYYLGMEGAEVRRITDRLWPAK
jgi:integrase/recombinase XerD